jgi:hypothetical protein
MHARIEHLLSIRDGEPVGAEVAEHVRQCPNCSGELQRLSTLRAGMRALPMLEPPALAWERIQQTIPERRTLMPPRKVGFAAAAAAAITLAVIALIARQHDRQIAESPAPADVSEQVMQLAVPHVEELVAQSQRLEQLLQILPQRPQIERVSTAATIDTIEQRIQWLDFQMSYASDGDLNEEQSRQLWRERVELMDSLVKVRYAEAGRSLSF